MKRVVSTYRYSNHLLGSNLIAELALAEFQSIEIFCTPQHFNHRTQESVRELARMLEEHRMEVHSLHSPTERDISSGRESGVPISISDTERIRRIEAMDEVKRALEVAERIPFRYLIQHIGSGRQSADPRKFDAAFNSLEHLVVFAKARGVTLALENTGDELGSPASLQLFLRETHLHDLKLCFDVGHAHIEGGIEAGFEAMQDRVAVAQIHDNHGEKDEHLLPYEGGINWDAALRTIASASSPVSIVMEVREQSAGGPTLPQIREAFEKIERGMGRQTAPSAEKQF